MFLDILLMGTWWTIILSASGFVIGAMLALPLTAMRNSPKWWLRTPTIFWIDLARAIPPITWLFIVFFGLPAFGITLSPLVAATLAIGLIAGAYITEIYRGGLRAIPRGQLEAARALNLPEFDRFWRIMVPQLVRVIQPSLSTHFIAVLKKSALASTIGVAELTFRAHEETARGGPGLYLFLAAGAMYFILSGIVAVFSRTLDARMKRRYEVV